MKNSVEHQDAPEPEDAIASDQLPVNVAGREDEKTPPMNTDLLAALVKTMQKSNPWISVPNARGKFKTALSFRDSPPGIPGGGSQYKR